MAIIRRHSAIADLEAIGERLARLGGLPLAYRFFEAVDESLIELEASPYTGALLFDTDDPLLKDIRHRQVTGFRKYVILYRPHPSSVEILHVVLGKRDISALFGLE